MANPIDAPALNPGSVNIKEVTLFKAGQEYPLKDFIVELSVFEDMFSNTMSATMILSDGLNLVGSLPITGGEIINISYTVPGFEDSQIFGRAFYVFAVRDRFPSSTDRQQMYMLSLMSLEAAVDSVTVVSKKYTGKPSEIAKQIFDEYLSMPRFWSKEYDMPAGLSDEETLTRPAWKKSVPQQNRTSLQLMPNSESKNKVTWVVPMWSPMKCINWLANRHLDEGSKAANTLAWESSQQFYFATVDSIFKAQENVNERKVYYYGFDDAMIERITKNNSTKNTLIEGYKKVENVAIPTNYDILRSQEMGHYSSTMHVFDVVTKKYDEYVFDYINNYSQFEHLHGKTNPTFPSQQLRNVHSYVTFRPKHKKIFNDFEDPKFEDWVLQRTSLLYDISNLKIEITVPGLAGTQAGEVVQFYYPKMAAKGSDENVENLIDRYLSGSYLVTAVRHIIARDKYTMKLEMVKESLASGLG
jgi:hypothetical protein